MIDYLSELHWLWEHSDQATGACLPCISQSALSPSPTLHSGLSPWDGHKWSNNPAAQVSNRKHQTENLHKLELQHLSIRLNDGSATSRKIPQKGSFSDSQGFCQIFSPLCCPCSYKWSNLCLQRCRGFRLEVSGHTGSSYRFLNHWYHSRASETRDLRRLKVEETPEWSQECPQLWSVFRLVKPDSSRTSGRIGVVGQSQASHKFRKTDKAWISCIRGSKRKNMRLSAATGLVVTASEEQSPFFSISALQMGNTTSINVSCVIVVACFRNSEIWPLV